MERDAVSLLGSCRQLLDDKKAVAGASAAFMQAAALFEMTGYPLEAREAYEEAYARGAPADALFSSILLSLQMNDTESAQRSLGALRGKGEGQGLLCEALSMAQRGDLEGARRMLADAAEMVGDQAVSLRASWLLYVLAGSDAEARQAASRLAARYPQSPESSIAAGSGAVQQAPVPGLFVSEGTMQNGAPAQSAASEMRAVQVGAFTMRENADDMDRELKAKGFAPAMREEQAKGKTVYRVYAALSVKIDEARALVEKLKSAGFTGLIVPAK